MTARRGERHSRSVAPVRIHILELAQLYKLAGSLPCSGIGIWTALPQSALESPGERHTPHGGYYVWTWACRHKPRSNLLHRADYRHFFETAMRSLLGLSARRGRHRPEGPLGCRN